MKPITLWYKYHEGEWKYNHYERGFTCSGTPIPDNEHQKEVWENNRWVRENAYMDGTTIKHLDEV